MAVVAEADVTGGVFRGDRTRQSAVQARVLRQRALKRVRTAGTNRSRRSRTGSCASDFPRSRGPLEQGASAPTLRLVILADLVYVLLVAALRC